MASTPHTPEYLPHEHETLDEWHTHAAGEQAQAEHGSQINAKSVWVWFILIVLSVAGTIAIVMRYWTGHVTMAKAERIETTVLSKEYWEAKAAADQRLNGYGWANAEAAKAGSVAIPLEKARAKVLEAYAKKK